jgi:uncharacterized protein (DUF697 family)
VKEARIGESDRRHLAVDGALAAQLAKELGRDAEPGAVRVGGPDGAAAYVRVLADAPSPEDEAALARAHRARVPSVVLARKRFVVPFVLAEDVLVVPPGQGFPVDDVTRAIARRLGMRSTPLAARVPALRPAVCDWLVTAFSRKNALIAGAVFLPGVDFPALTLNQMRMVLRIASAHGKEMSNERMPELLAVLGGGLALRAIGRELLDRVPVARWAVRAGVAYAGTLALGEVSRRVEAARAPATTARG